MNKYLCLHQDYLKKYYPARIHIDEERNTSSVIVCRNGFTEPDINARLHMKDEHIISTASFHMKTLPPKTYNVERLNTWFSSNIDTKKTRYRFVSPEEKRRCEMEVGFTENGPSYDEILQIYTLFYNYALIIAKKKGYTYIDRTMPHIDTSQILVLDNGSCFCCFSQDSYDESNADLIARTILKVYPHFIIINNHESEVIPNNYATLTINILSNPREILAIESNLRKTLITYGLQDLLSTII